MNNKLWVWGYVPDKVPGMMPFVNQETWCSLETAGSYLRAGYFIREIGIPACT